MRPTLPKVSTFAPAEDLANQVGQYIKAMKSVVADEQEYKDSEGKVVRDASTLAVIALALGLHDQDNKYKANAGALMKAAQDVAATKDYDSAKKAVAALEAVAAKEGGKAGGELKWEKVAPLPELMKQVPMINTKLKLYVKGTSFKKKAKDIAGYSAVIAAIAQGTIADTSATKNAEQVKLWQKFSEAMRDDAGDGERRHSQGRRAGRRGQGDEEAQPELRRLPRRLQAGGGRERGQVIWRGPGTATCEAARGWLR